MNSSEITFYDGGLEDFEELLKQYSENVSPDKALDAVEAGYTHIVSTFALERTDSGIKVGWGKYYGPMLEHGTRKMAARAHLKPLFERNKEKYYKKMTESIFG